VSGIYADVAEEKYEYWSFVVSDPLETMLSAGQKARDDSLAGCNKFVNSQNGSVSYKTSNMAHTFRNNKYHIYSVDPK
jgi:hypothetical protein